MVRSLILAAVASALAASGCAAGATRDLRDTLAEKPRFSTFAKAVESAELETPLVRHGPYTVFAPTNAAFERLPDDRRKALFRADRRDRLREVLAYHMVPREMDAAALAERDGRVVSLEGATLVLGRGEAGPRVNDAEVVSADIPAANGVIHAVDAVLIPPERSLREQREHIREILGIPPAVAPPSGS